MARCDAIPPRAGLAALVVTVAVMIGGCDGAKDRSAAGPATGSGPASPGQARTLPAEWYEDADRNLIPDFIEVEAGFDPRHEDCPMTRDCGPGANGAAFERRANILLILDSSGSMAARLGGDTKLALAKRAIGNFVESAPPDAALGLMVYGHRGNNEAGGRSESCAGTEILAPVGRLSARDVQGLAVRFEPRGWTPIAASLAQARTAFGTTSGNKILLVSDGLETCGGDPVRIARELAAGGLAVQVDVIGFDVGTADAAGLARIAAAGGGKYYNARSYRELDDYLRRQTEAIRQTQGAQRCELETMNAKSACDRQMALKVSTLMNGYARQYRARGDQQKRAEIAAMRAAMDRMMNDRRQAWFAPGRTHNEELRQQVRKSHIEIGNALGREQAKPAKAN